MLKSLNRILSIPMIFTLSFAPYAQASDHEARAEEYVKASHWRAKNVAITLVRNQALQAAQSILAQYALTGDQSVIFDRQLVGMKQIQTMLKLQGEVDQDLPALSASEIAELAKDFGKNLAQAEKHRLDVLNSAFDSQFMAKRAKEILTAMERELDVLCRDGVAVDLANPKLPQLGAFVPPFSVEIKYSTTPSGNSASASAGTFDGEHAALKYSLITAATTAAVFSEMTGTAILSKSAFDTAVAKMGAAGVSTGLLVVAAIVVTYALVENAVKMQEAKREAEEIRRGIKKMVFDLATAENVRSYTKDTCRKFIAPLKETKAVLASVAQSKSLPASFLETEEKVMSQFRDWMDKLEALEKSARALEASLTSLNEEEKKKQLEDKVRQLPEHSALDTATEGITPEIAGQLMQIAMVKLAMTTEETQRKTLERTRAAVGEINWDALHKKYAFLRKAAFVAHEKERRMSGSLPIEKLRSAYEAFDRLMIYSIESIFGKSRSKQEGFNLLADLKKKVTLVRSEGPQHPSVIGLTESAKQAELLFGELP